MKYLKSKFIVFMNQSPTYGQNYDRIFKKRLREKIQEFIERIIVYLFIK